MRTFVMWLQVKITPLVVHNANMRLFIKHGYFRCDRVYMYICTNNRNISNYLRSHMTINVIYIVFLGILKVTQVSVVKLNRRFELSGSVLSNIQCLKVLDDLLEWVKMEGQTEPDENHIGLDISLRIPNCPRGRLMYYLDCVSSLLDVENTHSRLR